MAKGFSQKAMDVKPPYRFVLNSAATALQIHNGGPAVVYVTEFDNDSGAPSDGTEYTGESGTGSAGFPIEPGQAIRVPGGSAYLSVPDDGDNLHARVSVIEES